MEKEYIKEGQVTGGAVGSIITLIVGVGIAVLVLIFVGVLSGQTYVIASDDINEITNMDIQGSINNSILAGFTALEQTGDYLPLIVLAVVIFLVLSLVLGFTAFSGGMGGGRSAL